MLATRWTVPALVAWLAAVPLAHGADLVSPLAPTGAWSAFDVDGLAARSGGLEWIGLDGGDPLSFSFDVAAGQVGTLDVVDGGFAGDRFTLYDHREAIGSTSVGSAGGSPRSVGTDFDAAWADTAYSRGTFTFGPGAYLISGSLTQSFELGGMPLDATVGGLRLSVSPVPEPSSLALMLTGVGVLALLRRRRHGR